MAEEEEETEEPSTAECEEEEEDELRPYDLSFLCHLLAFLISLTDTKKWSSLHRLTRSPDLASLRYGLSTINTLLEMNGDVLVNHPALIELLQGTFCKYIIQNAQSDDAAILALSLRVIFNLFQNLKSFLKVQLEVFFTSVHIRLADTFASFSSLTSSQPASTHEFLPKEAALESLLDFCQEPTVMIDLYTNVAARRPAHA